MSDLKRCAHYGCGWLYHPAYTPKCYGELYHGCPKDCTKFILECADESAHLGVLAERERCAKKAEEVNDFGPSTQCPDCGSDGQVLHWYMLGRKDAAAAIRKERK